MPAGKQGKKGSHRGCHCKIEHREIAEIIRKRLKDYDRSLNVSWEKLKNKHGL